MTFKKKAKKRGGYRENSGRPVGTGKYREPTYAVRIPESLLPEVKWLLERKLKKLNSKDVLKDAIRSLRDFNEIRKIYHPTISEPNEV